MSRTRLGAAASLLAIAVIAAACSSQASPVPTASEAPTASVAPSVAPSVVPSEAPVAPSEAPAAGEGIALADVDAELLVQAFESYDVTFGAPEVDEETGLTTIRGTKEDDVEVAIRYEDNTPVAVGVFDYSAGDVGLEEMGFAIGIFQPDAQEWLVEQLNAAIAAPGTPMTATMEFSNVTMTLEAYTDETGSIDLYIE